MQEGKKSKAMRATARWSKRGKKTGFFLWTCRSDSSREKKREENRRREKEKQRELPSARELLSHVAKEETMNKPRSSSSSCLPPLHFSFFYPFFLSLCPDHRSAHFCLFLTIFCLILGDCSRFTWLQSDLSREDVP